MLMDTYEGWGSPIKSAWVIGKKLNTRKANNAEDKTDTEDIIEELNVESQILGPEINRLLKLFIKYMTGPYRGRKPSSVKTVAGDVKRIFDVLDIKNNLDPLISNDQLLLKLYWSLLKKKTFSWNN